MKSLFNLLLAFSLSECNSYLDLQRDSTNSNTIVKVFDHRNKLITRNENYGVLSNLIQLKRGGDGIIFLGTTSFERITSNIRSQNQHPTSLLLSEQVIADQSEAVSLNPTTATTYTSTSNKQKLNVIKVVRRASPPIGHNSINTVSEEEAISEQHHNLVKKYVQGALFVEVLRSGYDFHGNFVYLEMKQYQTDGSSLYTHIASQYKRLPAFRDVLRASVQLTAAVLKLHANNLSHRDIKCENTLLEGHHLVLSDFDRLVPSSIGVQDTLGTRGFFPGHHFASNAPLSTVRGDVFATAVSIFRWCTGYNPVKAGYAFHEEKFITSLPHHKYSLCSEDFHTQLTSLIKLSGYSDITDEASVAIVSNKELQSLFETSLKLLAQEEMKNMETQLYSKHMKLVEMNTLSFKEVVLFYDAYASVCSFVDIFERVMHGLTSSLDKSTASFLLDSLVDITKCAKIHRTHRRLLEKYKSFLSDSKLVASYPSERRELTFEEVKNLVSEHNITPPLSLRAQFVAQELVTLKDETEQLLAEKFPQNQKVKRTEEDIRLLNRHFLTKENRLFLKHLSLLVLLEPRTAKSSFLAAATNLRKNSPSSTFLIQLLEYNPANRLYKDVGRTKTPNKTNAKETQNLIPSILDYFRDNSISASKNLFYKYLNHIGVCIYDTPKHYPGLTLAPQTKIDSSNCVEEEDNNGKMTRFWYKAIHDSMSKIVEFVLTEDALQTENKKIITFTEAKGRHFLTNATRNLQAAQEKDFNDVTCNLPEALLRKVTDDAEENAFLNASNYKKREEMTKMFNSFPIVWNVPQIQSEIKQKVQELVMQEAKETVGKNYPLRLKELEKELVEADSLFPHSKLFSYTPNMCSAEYATNDIEKVSLHIDALTYIKGVLRMYQDTAMDPSENSINETSDAQKWNEDVDESEDSERRGEDRNPHPKYPVVMHMREILDLLFDESDTRNIAEKLTQYWVVDRNSLKAPTFSEITEVEEEYTLGESVLEESSGESSSQEPMERRFGTAYGYNNNIEKRETSHLRRARSPSVNSHVESRKASHVDDSIEEISYERKYKTHETGLHSLVGAVLNKAHTHDVGEWRSEYELSHREQAREVLKRLNKGPVQSGYLDESSSETVTPQQPSQEEDKEITLTLTE